MSRLKKTGKTQYEMQETTATNVYSTALQAYSGMVEAVAVLLERGAAVDALDNEGWAPIHWAGVAVE